jgi:hypothetical protein
MTNPIEDEHDGWWICKHPLWKDAEKCCKERFSRNSDKSKQTDKRTSDKRF